MKFLKKIFNNTPNWLRLEYKFLYVDDIPERHIKSRIIYIVGNPIEPWLLAFNCPCGCKELIQLNLLKEAQPCWEYKITKKNKINISPSIWRIIGCKSHFFVRANKIDWVKNGKYRNN